MNEQPASEQRREKRFAAIAAINAGDPDVKASEVKVSAEDKEESKKKLEAERETAADCVEGFFEYQWRKMAKGTRKKKEDAKTRADADKVRAEDELARANASGDPTKMNNAEGELRKAIDNQKAATAEWDRVKNLDPNDTDACMGQSRGAAPRGTSKTDAPTPSVVPAF